MPKTVDILIGVVLVMLIMSMVVTILTQFVAAAWNLRGKALLRGVGDLLALLDRGLSQAQAFHLAAFLLRDPLISAPGLRGWRTLAGEVHREELTKLILEFAAKGPPEQPRWVTFIRAMAQRMPWLRRVGAQFPRFRDLIPTQAVLTDLHDKVNASLVRNGIQDPAVVLKDIRTAALELEKTNPELSNNARVNVAILHFATSDYVGKLNAWFDQSMDRVSDLFTFKIRRVTMVVAAVVALAVQLDTIGLFNRLGADDQLRRDLVTKAVNTGQFDPTKVLDQGGAAQNGQNASPAAPVPNQPQQPAPGTQQDVKLDYEQVRDNVRKLTRELDGIVALPASWQEWSVNWHEGRSPDAPFSWRMLVGIIISAALMSLGAPFWYEMLKDLVRFRSLIAQKDEGQRTERQTTQAAEPTPLGPAAVTPGTPTSPPTAAGVASLPVRFQGGERGDLSAIG